MENEEKTQQGYYYIIPAKLAESGDKTKALLYGVVTSLVNKEGYCWATSKYLGAKIGITSRTVVSLAINELQKEGWITVEIIDSYKRRIWLTDPLLKNQTGVFEEPNGGVRKNEQGCLKNQTGVFGKTDDIESIIKSNTKSNINEYTISETDLNLIKPLHDYCKENPYFKNIKNLPVVLKSIAERFGNNGPVLKELKTMTTWLAANPNREKKNYARFMVNWLNRVVEADKNRKAIGTLISGIGKKA
ncbi:MAG: hypothetical protein WC569_02850 [Candidatus Omnitrophota bacterium]